LADGDERTVTNGRRWSTERDQTEPDHIGDASHRFANKSPLGKEGRMEFILWVLAVILVIAGIVAIVRGAVLWGIVLIVVGLLVGPGGVSVFA
jgi:hypothetical protein